jgi:hypothetical protein
MSNFKVKTEKESNGGDEIIRIQKKKGGFGLLDNGFLDDIRLSWKAKGILTYLLSKPDGCKVIVQDIVNNGGGGITSVYSGLNELKKFGYYNKYPVRDGNRIVRWESVVSVCPDENKEEPEDKHK